MAALLLGGIGLFLLGMWLMTDGLKLAAAGALQSILATATSSHWRGLLAGLLITALVQSSSAVTVATIGFVNAGLLTLGQSMWVVFGANVGTTTTGWLVATIGIKLDMAALALPMVGLGMLARLVATDHPRLAGLGQALAGFGAFFLGIGFLQQGFEGWTVAPDWVGPDQPMPVRVLLFVGVGTLLTLLTQSSSAAIAIALTASAGGGIPLELAAATVIGTNIGTTSTAVFAAIGATPPARRVAAAHIVFNLLTATVALILLPWLLEVDRLLATMLEGGVDMPLMLAVFHTLYKCLGIALMWPLASRLERGLERRFVSLAEQTGRPRHLDTNLAGVPDLALRSLVAETQRMAELAFGLARERIGDPVAQASGAAQRQAGVMALGHAIRAFIGTMNRGPLPDEVADAVPDLIRGVQHLEDVATLSAAIDAGPAGAASLALSDEMTALRDLVAGAMVLAPHDTEPGEEAEAESDLAETEQRYQRIKSALLRGAAAGRYPVAAMEAELLAARRLRQCAQSAHKARRRLGHLFLRHAPDV